MKTLIGLLSRIAAFAAAVAVALMMVHVTVAVFLRVGFDEPLLGTIEIVSHFYMVAAIFLGIFVAAWQNAHIRVDVLANLLPRAVRRGTDLIAELISLAFFAAFAWGLWLTALRKTAQREEVDAIFAHLTVWPARWLAVAGIVLTAAVFAWRLVRMLGGADTSEAASGLVIDDEQARR